VYRPVVDTVPVVLEPPTTPSTAHFTPTFVVPVTADVNCLVVLTVTLAVVGLMVIATVVTVTAALAVRVVSALLVTETA
jgi:hypothetical protein